MERKAKSTRLSNSREGMGRKLPLLCVNSVHEQTCVQPCCGRFSLGFLYSIVTFGKRRVIARLDPLAAGLIAPGQLHVFCKYSAPLITGPGLHGMAFKYS